MGRLRVIGIVLIVVFLALLLIFGMRRSPQPTPMGLRPVNITNIPGEGRSGVFAITNSSSRQIGFFPAHAQIRTRGVWPSEIRLKPPPSTPAEYRAHTLGPHAEAQFSTALPTGDGVCRVPVLWGLTPSKMDFIRAILHENWMAFQAGRPLPGRAGVGVGQMRTNFTSELRL